jgi:hypothetical protein
MVRDLHYLAFEQIKNPSCGTQMFITEITKSRHRIPVLFKSTDITTDTKQHLIKNYRIIMNCESGRTKL